MESNLFGFYLPKMKHIHELVKIINEYNLALVDNQKIRFLKIRKPEIEGFVLQHRTYLLVQGIFFSDKRIYV